MPALRADVQIQLYINIREFVVNYNGRLQLIAQNTVQLKQEIDKEYNTYFQQMIVANQEVILSDLKQASWSKSIFHGRGAVPEDNKSTATNKSNDFLYPIFYKDQLAAIAIVQFIDDQIIASYQQIKSVIREMEYLFLQEVKKDNIWYKRLWKILHLPIRSRPRCLTRVT